jgi:hypothetical protein
MEPSQGRPPHHDVQEAGPKASFQQCIHMHVQYMYKELLHT